LRPQPHAAFFPIPDINILSRKSTLKNIILWKLPAFFGFYYFIRQLNIVYVMRVKTHYLAIMGFQKGITVSKNGGSQVNACSLV